MRTRSVQPGTAVTPERLTVLDALVEDGKISAANAQRLRSGERVRDLAWEIILKIQRGQADGDGPLELEFSVVDVPQIDLSRYPCWVATFQAASRVIPVDFEPLHDPAGDLPFDRVLRVLDTLSRDGWAVVHVSEDRQIKEDRTAVNAVRYLMTRTSPEGE